MLEIYGFALSDDFTVAEILMTHVLGGGTDQDLLQPHANIRADRARCSDRPAWKKPLDAYCARVVPA